MRSVYSRTSASQALALRYWRARQEGRLAGRIDTPRSNQQLARGTCRLSTAQAHLQLAAITANLNEDLLKTRFCLGSPQERDNADGAWLPDSGHRPNQMKATSPARAAAIL